MKVKTKAGWFRFFYDLHVSGGFYAALLLLILALTGLTWSFGWYRNAFYSVFGISANPPQAHHAPASSGAKKPAKKKTDYTQWAEVLSALKSHYPDFNLSLIHIFYKELKLEVNGGVQNLFNAYQSDFDPVSYTHLSVTTN